MSIESLASLFGVTAVFAAIVAALAGAASWHFSTKVSTAKDEALAKFKQESKVEIALAKESAAKANEKASLSNEKSALLEKEAAQAKLELEKLRNNIADTRNRIKPRVIGKKQYEKFKSLLLNTPPAQATVNSIMGDGEARTFAKQLEKLLTESKWNMSIGSQVVYSKPILGVKLIVRDQQSVTQHVKALYDILYEAGIFSEIIENGKEMQGDIKILIGNKPIE